MPFLLRVELPDVPGSLGRLAGAIGEAGGDIEAIEIVEKRHDGTAVDDVLLELPPTAMPDTIVSACNQLPGVHVVWISRYAAGGNLFLDLEAVEDLTANPTEALDRLVDLLPVTFRADWAARVHRAHGQRYSTEAAPSDLPFVELVRTERPSLVLLPSPNNPTGTALEPEVVGVLCEALGDDGLLGVDEAYGVFRRTGTPSAIELLPSYPNLVVTRTMSKAFAGAGLRLGYLAADPRICDAIRVVRLPYHLSAVSQAVALAALRHHEELLGKVDELRHERDETVAWLRGRGLDVADSDANFALFGTFPDRHAVWQRLLDQGVLVREVGPEGWLRVSIGTPEEMTAFREALDAVLDESGSK